MTQRAQYKQIPSINSIVISLKASSFMSLLVTEDNRGCQRWPWPLLSPPHKNLKRASSFTKRLHKRSLHLSRGYCVSDGSLRPSVSRMDRNPGLMGTLSEIARRRRAETPTHLVRAVSRYSSPMDHFAPLQCLLINLGLSCVG